MTPAVDIAFEEYDSLIRLKPMTQKARYWFNSYVAVEDPSLIVNGWIPTDREPAFLLLRDAVDDGLLIAPFSWNFLYHAWNMALPKIFMDVPMGDS